MAGLSLFGKKFSLGRRVVLDCRDPGKQGSGGNRGAELKSLDRGCCQRGLTPFAGVAVTLRPIMPRIRSFSVIGAV